MACRRNNRAGICFLFLVSCRSRTYRFLCLISNLLFLSMSFLELFIYFYDGVSPPILSMPSLSMILVQGSDQIKSMKWRLVFLVLSPFLFVAFYLLFIVMGQGLGFMVMVSRHGGTYQESQSDTTTGSTDPGTISCIQIRRFYLHLLDLATSIV
jgi:hypothetical protein